MNFSTDQSLSPGCQWRGSLAMGNQTFLGEFLQEGSFRRVPEAITTQAAGGDALAAHSPGEGSGQCITIHRRHVMLPYLTEKRTKRKVRAYPRLLSECP